MTPIMATQPPTFVVASDHEFAGSIPAVYDALLVPLIFEQYALDLAHRVAALHATRVLEIAAGTGVVTRALARATPASTSIVATDLNVAMLDQAEAVGTSRPVQWQLADALALPHDDETFDVVVCQFGVMFLPDKPRAFAEAHRVLAPGGVLLFNVWDRIAENEFADTVTTALASVFPDDPPRFLARVPHGYHDRAAIADDLAAGGFRRPCDITTLTARSRADTPRVPAVAYCLGTPLRNELEARDASGLDVATAAAALAVERRFGAQAVVGKLQAHVVVATRH